MALTLKGFNMLKRIGNNVANTTFNLKLASVVLLSAISGWPSGGSAFVKITTDSGKEYIWEVDAQTVTDLVAAGLTGFNNNLQYIRKSEIESVELAASYFPSGSSAPVVVTMKNGKTVSLTVDQNTYNDLLS